MSWQKQIQIQIQAQIQVEEGEEEEEGEEDETNQANPGNKETVGPKMQEQEEEVGYDCGSFAPATRHRYALCF